MAGALMSGAAGGSTWVGGGGGGCTACGGGGGDGCGAGGAGMAAPSIPQYAWVDDPATHQALQEAEAVPEAGVADAAIAARG
eukprot:2178312-Prymnesium_polylepis.1